MLDFIDDRQEKKHDQLNEMGYKRVIKGEFPYIDRELSWIEFNKRVLNESKDKDVPLLEKLKFTTIVSSNFDEFFMIRVGGLLRLLQARITQIEQTGKSVVQEINDIHQIIRSVVEDQYAHLMNDILPSLEKSGLSICRYKDLPEDEKNRLTTYFNEQVYPLLTPLAVDAGHPFPFLRNLKLNLMISFKTQLPGKPSGVHAFIEVPSMLPRFIPVSAKTKSDHQYLLIESLISEHLDKLFKGLEIESITQLRVTRNKDYDLLEREVDDLALSLQSELRDLSNQPVVRLEVNHDLPKNTIKLLCNNLNIEENSIYKINGPINICDFKSLIDKIDRPDLKDPTFNPRIPQRFASGKDIFSVIREGDALLHHPFDSFAVVLDLLNTAANDPDVLAIKQTLYRVGSESPIVAALRRAAENGKQVTAVIELKVRFDEQHNMDWALQMRDSGVNVVFGFVAAKIHCKATLIVRQEKDKLRRYAHLSTGNYNVVTAGLYTDIGLLTCNPEFGNDVNSLFNILTGFNSWADGELFPKKQVASMFNQFLVSPVNSFKRIVKLIDREIEKSSAKSPGRIIAKMNSLVDPNIIEKLIEASKAGVKIDLIVRGICCLAPGIKGISENIRVVSIIDRFLEHSRIYYFHNGGEPEIYSGSADWMPRSFINRVEIIYPIHDNAIKSRIINEILMTYLADNTKAWDMQSDGTYIKRYPKKDEEVIRSQVALMQAARKGGIKSPPYHELIKKIGGRRK